MLEQAKPYNEFTPEFRKKLEEHVRSLGKKVRYRFHIENQNPDPEKYNGPIIWPGIWTLSPTVFRITDKNEKRDGQSRSKQVGLIDTVDEKGVPNRFKKLKVESRNKGILDFVLEDAEGNEDFEAFNKVMFLELHPKNKNGLNSDATETKIFERVDIKAAAVASRKERKLKDEAKKFAEDLTDEEVKHYIAALGMDETDDIEILRNQLESLAETDPDMLLSMRDDNKVTHQSVVKRGIDQAIIGINPQNGEVTWASNGNVIVDMGPNSGTRTDIARLADWFASGEKKSEAAYKKLQSLVI